MRRVAFTVAALLLVGPVWASNPDEPLDCSDWVFLEPGLSCSMFHAFPAGPTDSDFARHGSHMATTVDGALLTIRFIPTQSGPSYYDLGYRLEIVRLNNSVETILATVESRAVPGADCRDHIRNDDVYLAYPESTESRFSFDPLNGRLLIPLWSYSQGDECPNPDYNVWWIASIGGFTTTFEVLQTYEPTANNLGFRVPYMPEGFQYADWFDTYYGDLATVGDWSQALPLQCGYPTSAPQAGDYLTVDDLPTPPPGQGYYYVTTVNYQGQKRYGREAMNGVLSGRDPALLPACN